MNGLLLVVDTASGSVGTALVPAIGEPLVRVEGDNASHSRHLLSMVDELFVAGGELPEAVVVVTGPGGYAGIRVGIAAAEGLAFGWCVPLLGVPTLQAVAAAAGVDGLLAAVHPAGRGEYAVQLFEGLEPVGPLYPARRDELPRLQIAGEGASALGGIEVGTADRIMAAAKLARLGITQKAEAIYLREPHVTLSRARWRRERTMASLTEEERR